MIGRERERYPKFEHSHQPLSTTTTTTIEHNHWAQQCQNPLNKVSYRWMIQRPLQYCVPIVNRRSRIEPGSFKEGNRCTRHETQREREREIRNIYIYFLVITFVWLVRKFEGKCLGEWEWEGWMFWLRKSEGKGKCFKDIRFSR